MKHKNEEIKFTKREIIALLIMLSRNSSRVAFMSADRAVYEAELFLSTLNNQKNDNN